MTKKIIYTNSDGSVSVLVPILSSGLTIEEILAKDIPAGVSYALVTDDDIPSDRTFRDAWKMDGKRIVIDMISARKIKQTEIRNRREPLMAALDIQYMRAIENKDEDAQKRIINRKQALRDAPQHPSIIQATAPDDLKRANPLEDAK